MGGYTVLLVEVGEKRGRNAKAYLNTQYEMDYEWSQFLQKLQGKSNGLRWGSGSEKQVEDILHLLLLTDKAGYDTVPYNHFSE